MLHGYCLFAGKLPEQERILEETTVDMPDYEEFFDRYARAFERSLQVNQSLELRRP